MKSLSFAFIALTVTALQAQPILDLFDNDRFHAAYFDASRNEVTFRPFQELNWEAKARRFLTWLNLDRPSPSQIARLLPFEPAGPGSRSVDFRAPVEGSVNRPTYLLVYSDGVVPVRPIELKGSVTFQFDRSLTAVEHRSFSGYVVGQSSHAVTSAAFAILGRPEEIKAVNSRPKFERRRTSASAVYDFVDGARTATWTNQAIDCTNPKTSSCSDAASVVSFHLHDGNYLLVKWKDAVCESAYTLFLVTEAVRPIAGNIYGCDP